MKPLTIRSPHLGDSEYYCVATTPRELDVIAYVVLCNELAGYLPGQERDAPTSPEIFEALPECDLKNKARMDWINYLGRVAEVEKVRKEFSYAIEKIEARDPTGCWDMFPKYLVERHESRDPLEFLDVEYHPRTLDPME